MIVELVFQLLQMTLVIMIAPLLTGVVRATKARLTRRRGPPLIQPYRDLVRLARKEAIVADSASWLFRLAPYLVFASTWVAAALIPTFATGAVLLVGGSDRDHRAARRGAVLPGAGGTRRRHELRRPGREPRVAVRRAGRAGDDRDRLLARAHRGLDAVVDGGGLHDLRRRRPARHARHGAGRPASSWRWPRTGGCRSTIRRPISS